MFSFTANSNKKMSPESITEYFISYQRNKHKQFNAVGNKFIFYNATRDINMCE